MSVPPLKMYWPTEDKMTSEQQQYYQSWIREWKLGRIPDIDGQISYVFCYAYTILMRATIRPKWAIRQLQRIKDSYPHEEKLVDFCGMWISDCYLIRRNYRAALQKHPRAKIGSRNTRITSRLLSLKLHLWVNQLELA
jgi:hypothetical protein